MFIKRNRTRLAGKAYASVLLVQGRRVPAKLTAGRPRADEPPPKTALVHETLANLSRLAQSQVPVPFQYISLIRVAGRLAKAKR